MKTKKQLIIPSIIVIVMIVFDQITKLFAQVKLAGGNDFVLIPKVFRLQYLENQSAAFSMDPVTLLDKIFHFKAFSNNPDLFLKTKMWFFVILTLVVLILVAILYYKIPQNKRFLPLNITIILLFAGAIGNCVDRIWHNYVIDFFYFELINFPVFNVADIYVTFAAIGLIILLLFYYKEDDFKVIFPSKKEKKIMNTETFEVQFEQENERIDKYISSIYPEKSRSFFQKLIKSSHVLVNDKPVKANYIIKADDIVSIEFPDSEETNIKAENLPLDILYEDEDVLIVNKPKNMVVHPSAGHYSGTLVNAIMYHCKDALSGINGEIRPGIVHRIDMNTTGSLIICKNDKAHIDIADQIKIHSVNRIYEGIVLGNLKDDEGTIEGPIGRNPKDRKKMAIVESGKEATTHYKVLKRFDNYTYCQFKLETGRTHQIRVHMSSIGHPLLGDDLYGTGEGVKGQFKHLVGQTLHAKTIGFVQPTTKEYVEISAPLPAYFEELLKKLENM